MPKSIGYIHTNTGTRVATTNTSYTEVIESDALVPGKTYHIICTALIEGSSVSQVFDWRLYDTTNSAEIADSVVKREPSNGNQGNCYHFVGKITAGSDGGGIALQQKSPHTDYTVGTEYVSMVIFDLSELRSSDFFFLSDSTQTQHTDAYVDRVTKTIQNTTAGDDWLVIGWGSFSMDSTTKGAALTLSHTNGGSTSAEPEIVFEGEDLTEILAFLTSRVYTIGTSGTSVWKLQTKDPSLHASTPNDYEAGALLGIRLNAFADHVYNYNSASTLFAAVSGFEGFNSISFTPSQSGPVVAFSTNVYQGTAAGDGGFTRLQVDGTSSPNNKVDNERQGKAYDTTDRMAHANLTVYTGARGVTNTIDVDSKRAKEDSLSDRVLDRNLVAFSTELAYDTPTVTGKMRRPGMFRRGGGRKTSKRLRR